MNNLVEFLLARIAEDEDAARIEVGRRDVILTGAFAPARILAECEAKRRIVEEHPHLFEEGDGRLIGDRWSCQTCHNGYTDWWCLTLRLLALPYADHPDYRQEWRP